MNINSSKREQLFQYSLHERLTKVIFDLLERIALWIKMCRDHLDHYVRPEHSFVWECNQKIELSWDDSNEPWFHVLYRTILYKKDKHILFRLCFSNKMNLLLNWIISRQSFDQNRFQDIIRMTKIDITTNDLIKKKSRTLIEKLTSELHAAKQPLTVE